MRQGNYPDNVTSTSRQRSRTIVFHLTHSVNPAMVHLQRAVADPAAPDPGDGRHPRRPAQRTVRQDDQRRRRGLFKYDAAPGRRRSSTYTTSPLWKVVDGPCKLQSFSRGWSVPSARTRSTPGRSSRSITKFVELPFTSDTAEFDALRTGELDVGYLPSEDLPQKRRPRARATTCAVEHLRNQLHLRQPAQPGRRPDPAADVCPAGDGDADRPKGCDPGVLRWVRAADLWTRALQFQGNLADAYEESCPYRSTRRRRWPCSRVTAGTLSPNGVSTCSDPGSGAGHCGAGVRAGSEAAVHV